MFVLMLSNGILWYLLGAIGWLVASGIFFRVWCLRGEPYQSLSKWEIRGWDINSCDNTGFWELSDAMIISFFFWWAVIIIIAGRETVHFLGRLGTAWYTKLFLPKELKPQPISPPLDEAMRVGIQQVNLIAPADID